MMDAPVKICPVCYVFHYNAQRVCSCGHVFYVRVK